MSAASAWEISTTARLESRTARGAPSTATTITSRDALTAGSLSWEHRDPFDRMIVSQCLVSSSTLATADRAVAAFPGVATPW